MSRRRLAARAGTMLVAAWLIGVATAEATDLRGRVDTRNPLNGYFHPLPNARVDLASRGQIVARTLTGYDGFYYFRNVPPGAYEIVVNNQVRVGTMIQPRPYQDIPPILFAPR